MIDVKQEEGKAMQQAETAEQQAELEGQMADKKEVIAAAALAREGQEQAALRKGEAATGKRSSRIA